MRKRFFFAALPLLLFAACDDFSSAPADAGELRWKIDRASVTRSETEEIPDTNDFILTVTDSSGEILYEGLYGNSPEYMKVSPGSYTVRAVSLVFTAPAFERPQYGDEQTVLVPSGASVTVKLQCSLLNAGMLVRPSEAFTQVYPDGKIYLKQGGNRLTYGYQERRIAYFEPGDVSLILYSGGIDETLLTRTLRPRDVLTINLNVPSGTQGSVEVAVDTTRNWMSEDYTMGEDNSRGSSPSDAISVPDAAAHAGENGVWITGYIVGGDLSSAGKSVKTENITKDTHFAVAARSSVTEKASCVAVELPSGSVRDALNLVDHPELIGSRVWLKGNIVESYYGTTGLKGTSDYEL